MNNYIYSFTGVVKLVVIRNITFYKLYLLIRGAGIIVTSKMQIFAG